MKIAIPVKENSIETPVDDRFARAAFIAIYDTVLGSYAFHKNTVSDAHGAGPKMAEFLAEQGVDTLIAPSVGKNAFTALEQAGIKIFLSTQGSAKDNIEAVIANKGLLMEVPGPSHK